LKNQSMQLLYTEYTYKLNILGGEHLIFQIKICFYKVGTNYESKTQARESILVCSSYLLLEAFLQQQ
jgi:hypothetical protein